jgi:hypothetical protein
MAGAIPAPAILGFTLLPPPLLLMKLVRIVDSTVKLH